MGWRTLSLLQQWMLFVLLFFAQKYSNKLVWWDGICGSLWLWFCGQDGHFDWFRCVLAICFTTGGKLWHCRHDGPSHSFWLNSLWSGAFMPHGYGSQCISSVIVFECYRWRHQIFPESGIHWNCWEGSRECESCVAGVWEDGIYGGWTVWGGIAMVTRCCISPSEQCQVGCHSATSFGQASCSKLRPWSPEWHSYSWHVGCRDRGGGFCGGPEGYWSSLLHAS